ncbi:MAG: sulfopyruvate decarboxylase subunit alpha [Alphaproteobacteria bacterium]
MSTPTELLWRALRQEGADFFVSVPCKLLGNMINLLQEAEDVVYTPVSREEEGVGLLAGAWLAGRTPVMIMQNSGLGNSVNAILSLLHYYRIPAVFVMSHRGSDGETIEAQFQMGSAVANLLTATRVPYYELSSVDDLNVLPEAMATAREKGQPVGLLLPFSFWKGDA